MIGVQRLPNDGQFLDDVHRPYARLGFVAPGDRLMERGRGAVG